MIVVIAPTPAPWIAATVAALAARTEVELWAPWAVAERWAALPGAVGAFAARRRCVGAVGVAGWPLVVAAGRAWAGAEVDRRFAVDELERAAVDAWAARRLARMPRRPALVIAVSGAATRTLAVARDRDVRTALVVDRPWLRQLNADLDRAAAAQPGDALLRRFRAPRAAIVRQEHERALADHVVVRGRYAAEVCTSDGVALDRLVALPAPAPAVATAVSAGAVVALAGGATARAGLDVALRLLAAQPDLRLRLRPVDGVELPELVRSAQIEVWSSARGITDGVLAVIAPAWCESYPPEVAAAAASGVPVIATAAGAGFALAHPIVPGSVAALATAVRAVAAGASPPPAPPPLPALVDLTPGLT